jgi:two-component system, OmpR family, alkaline phosphatase synthesis response regulator PhoP
VAKERILIVDDEKDLLELMAYNLGKEGYLCTCVTTGEEAIEKSMSMVPDLIVLDVMLPKADGFEVFRALKKKETTANIPILMVTAKSEDTDIVSALELGADDYITKPFSPKVLIARIRAVLRRSKDTAGTSTSPEEILRIQGIEIDPARHEVTAGGTLIDLSATEFAILHFLARNAGWVFSRNKIIDAVKGKDYPVTERSVDVQILGLRKKLGEYGALVQTVRGVGYRFKGDG